MRFSHETLLCDCNISEDRLHCQQKRSVGQTNALSQTAPNTHSSPLTEQRPGELDETIPVRTLGYKSRRMFH